MSCPPGKPKSVQIQLRFFNDVGYKILPWQAVSVFAVDSVVNSDLGSLNQQTTSLALGVNPPSPQHTQNKCCLGKASRSNNASQFWSWGLEYSVQREHLQAFFSLQVFFPCSEKFVFLQVWIPLQDQMQMPWLLCQFSAVPWLLCVSSLRKKLEIKQVLVFSLREKYPQVCHHTLGTFWEDTHVCYCTDWTFPLAVVLAYFESVLCFELHAGFRIVHNFFHCENNQNV